MSAPGDEAERREALDPGRSFIVEAPAGSGKTELLTQRYLRLLAAVERPEQVVAITFTRKAAAEMRERVVTSLRAAAGSSPDMPRHRLVSVELARSVLARSEQQRWSLLEQSQRLRILTIDALNRGLARHLPLTSSAIVSAAVTDDAEPIYRRAARNTIRSLAEQGETGNALRQLLQAADNSLARLENWLRGALGQRDGWMRLLLADGGQDLPDIVRQNVATLIDVQAAGLSQLAGRALEQQLLELLAMRANTDSSDVAATDARGPVQAREAWRTAADFLLTRSGQWRRRLTVAEGFPPDQPALKKAGQELLAACRATDGLEQRLASFASLPADTPGPEQRETLAALGPVLKRLLAELRLAFSESRTVDHTELALAAQQALGASDAPSDLLLALDRRIEHILVDEFQDTSYLQWGLLERLTGGWEPSDGRTLFLVGDPMQSIYRFRDADVSLFHRARRHGIGQVRLHPLRLQLNYRSAPALVDWVNSVFTAMFADRQSEDRDASPFRPATSGVETVDTAGVSLHRAATGNDEVERVVDIVREETAARPGGTIGILVRSRSHLIGLRAALATAGISAHAIEIDSLTDTGIGTDLVGLTSALLHPGDRLSWLGLLRGPWCGIGYRDLYALCAHDSDRSIWSLLHDEAAVAGMTADARARAGWFRRRLAPGLLQRATASLGTWVRTCWLLLDGPSCLAAPEALAAAESFFTELERLASCADIDDPAELSGLFSRPVGGEAVAISGVEIMTIHRAKGLEFDTVILPGMSKTTSGNKDKLLIYSFFDLPDSSTISLLAGQTANADPLAAFLRRQQRDDDADERCRLAYVAATRARRRLHLLGDIADETGQPREGSLLGTLWPGVGPDFGQGPADARESGTDPDRDDEATVLGELVELPLRRLRLPEPEATGMQESFGALPAAEARPEFEWVHPASVQVGTLIHRELQRLAESWAKTGNPEPPAVDPDRYRRELALLGVEREDLPEAGERIGEALSRVWQDPIGRWVLEPRPEAWSELRLTLVLSGRLEHLQLDRSFVENGIRWIVDYKTGRHLGADIDRFLDSEQERYRDQLERYARAVASFDERPIRVGLYFPLLGKLRDWDPATTS